MLIHNTFELKLKENSYKILNTYTVSYDLYLIVIAKLINVILTYA